VQSFSELLERHLGDAVDDETAEYLAFIRQAAERMKSLVESLREYARLNTAPVDRQPVDTGDCVKQVLEEQSRRIEACQAKIELSPLPTVEADSPQLRAVFRGLITNALEAASPERTLVIRVSCQTLDDAWQFRVWDNGVGLLADQAERIFDPLIQARPSDVPTQVGMGLAICRRIIHNHGGRIWCDSTAAEGTSFYFTLPRTKDRSRNN
jgi:signal transduction histidine kinase